ncbi:MAG: hypothetical protein IKE51_01860 [Solobacterium sp.]|nr:hypothetical protein [Solobacterium sp.]
MSKSLIRRLLYIGIGALIGLGVYYFTNCSSGTCPITSDPTNSMLYMGFIGFLLSGGCCGESCDIDRK